MTKYPFTEIKKIDLLNHPIDLEVIRQIPEHLARKYRLIPFSADEQSIHVAMDNPTHFVALEDIQVKTRKKVIPYQAIYEEIMYLVNQLYVSDNVRKKREVLEQQIKYGEVKEGAGLAWLESILEEASELEAADIHIQPLQERIEISYRIDGKLKVMHQVDIEILSMLSACIKNMAELDIAEKRLPQDGRICRVIKNKKVEFRVNTLPVLLGEKIMLRIMKQYEKRIGLHEIGFQCKDLELIKELIHTQRGLIIFTGPTGSGKSTSLTAVIDILNDATKSILTVEDPVEMVIDGIGQVQVNEKSGLTFPEVLRAMLRQAPDIMMVGEMRDQETAQIAARAALTGHLVFSTLHTGDAISSVIRLIDMGVEEQIVGNAIKAVVAQRLVRKICPCCKESYQTTVEEEKIYNIKEGTTLYKGYGCMLCNGTGYKGRKAVYEIFNVGNELKELVNMRGLNIKNLRKIAKKKGMKTLKQNVYEDMISGYTTLEEAYPLMYE